MRQIMATGDVPTRLGKHKEKFYSMTLEGKSSRDFSENWRRNSGKETQVWQAEVIANARKLVHCSPEKPPRRTPSQKWEKKKKEIKGAEGEHLNIGGHRRSRTLTL